MSQKGQEPATKQDILSSQEELAGMMNSSFQRVTDDIGGLKQRLTVVESDVKDLKSDVRDLKQDMETVKGTMGRVLDIVQSIDGRMKNLEDIPERVT